MCLTSEIQTPITPLFLNENIKCLVRTYQNYLCFQKKIWFLHFHSLPCELEPARVLYKKKKKKKKKKNTRENSDVFNSRDEIYLVFTSLEWSTAVKTSYKSRAVKTPISSKFYLAPCCQIYSRVTEEA